VNRQAAKKARVPTAASTASPPTLGTSHTVHTVPNVGSGVAYSKNAHEASNPSATARSVDPISRVNRMRDSNPTVLDHLIQTAFTSFMATLPHLASVFHSMPVRDGGKPAVARHGRIPSVPLSAFATGAVGGEATTPSKPGVARQNMA
jgi:hypothetical protein